MRVNAKFEYLYRDGGNYKNWGSVIFSNPNDLSLEAYVEEMEKIVSSSPFFHAAQAKVPDRHFSDYDPELDHNWHECHSISETDENPTDMYGRSVDVFMKDIKMALAN